ncbi:MAG: M48 family metallopeptidase [Spirochaetota bacterium]
MERKQFEKISPRAWEHPADRAALAALKQVPGLNEVVKFFLGMTGEKQIRLLFLSSAVRVSPRQFPRLDELVDEACRVLDVADKPELYVTQNPALNAGAIGVQRPFMTLNSSMLETLDDEETLAVIAHELGHIMSGHVLYKTLLWFLLNMASVVVRIPVAQLVLLGVVAALKEWDRKSELSADRAGLIVVQDPAISKTVLMKLAGGKHIDDMDLDEFYRQAEDYDAGGDILDGVYKVLNIMGQSHPFPVLRVKAIQTWATDGSYERVLAGDYPRRDAEEEDIAQDLSEATKAYQDELKGSNDPLAKAVSDLGEGLENVRQEAEKFFNSVFGGR